MNTRYYIYEDITVIKLSFPAVQTCTLHYYIVLSPESYCYVNVLSHEIMNEVLRLFASHNPGNFSTYHYF
jgi:hypothetical protein